MQSYQPPPESAREPYQQPYQQSQPGYQQPYPQAQPGYQQRYQQPYAPGAMPYAPGQRDWLVTLLLCIFTGVFGVHRFYTGNIGIGIAQLLTAGGCGIWMLVDLVLILTDNYRDVNGLPLRKAA